MSKDLYPQLEMDFKNFNDIPIKDIQEESVFALSMIPILGNQALEAASKLNIQSTEDEISKVKNSLYRQMVVLDISARVQDGIYSPQPFDSETLTKKYIEGSTKEADTLVDNSEKKGLELQRTLAKAFRCCENKLFDELANVITEHKEYQKKQTDVDLNRTKIKVINNQGQEFHISGESEAMRKQLKDKGLTQDDMNYIDANLNQTTLTGNSMGVINMKQMNSTKHRPFNGNCNEVVIRVGASGMEALVVYATIRNPMLPEEEKDQDIKVATSLKFDSSKTGNKIPTEVKVKVEHKDLNDGIAKLKNIPTEVKKTEVKNIMFEKVKLYLEKVINKLKDFAKRIENILTESKSKKHPDISDYLSKSTSEVAPLTIKESTIDKFSIKQEEMESNTRKENVYEDKGDNKIKKPLAYDNELPLTSTNQPSKTANRGR